MKRLLAYLLLVLVLTFNFQSWTKADDIKVINNKTYCGCLKYDSGAVFRIQTIFRINEENLVWGNYLLENYDRDESKETFGDGEVYDGNFYKGKFDLKNKNKFLKILWIDDFGDGYLNANFSSDFTEFNGKFGLTSRDGEWSWDGKICELVSE